MNIVILCLQNGGFGDLLFAQKFAFELNRYFRQNEVDANVSIVALPESINDMKKLGLMEEFKIPVATPHDIYEKTQDSSAKFEIDYMIVAPSFTSKEKFDWDGKDMFGMNGYAALDSRGNLHQSSLENRTLYIPEYNSEGAAAVGLHAQFFENTKTKPRMQRTGISNRAGNAGLLISNDITQATLSSEADPASEKKVNRQYGK